LIQDTHGAGMIDAIGRQALAQEALARLAIGGELGVQDLDGG
jgi:hypothetical protein